VKKINQRSAKTLTMRLVANGTQTVVAVGKSTWEVADRHTGRTSRTRSTTLHTLTQVRRWCKLNGLQLDEKFALRWRDAGGRE
jgi:hypothetical protein